MTHTNEPTNNAVAVHSGSALAAVDNRMDMDLIKKTYAKDLDDNELNLLVAHGNQMGLSVIKRQIYGIKRGGTMAIQIGIDGYRAITESHPDFAGYTESQWCGPDGQWVDVWLNPGPPAAARIGIYRKGFPQPIWGIATYAEFVQTYYDKYTKKQKPNSMWEKMPANQLLKCAESQAHRRFNPGVLGGTEMYDEGSPEVEQVEAMGIETTVTVSGGNAHEEWNKANRRLRAIASDHGVTNEQLKLHARRFGKESLKDLTAQQLNGLSNSMTTNPEKVEGYFQELAEKFGGVPHVADSENAHAGQEADQVQAEPEETHEGEYAEYTEVTEDGEIIPPASTPGNFQSELIDMPGMPEPKRPGYADS